MTPDEALLTLARATADAAAAELSGLCPGATTIGTPAVARHVESALDGVPAPSVAWSAASADGVAGTAVLLLSLEGAHRLAAILMGGAADAPVADGPLTDLEASTVGDAVAQVLGAAAAATGDLLGVDVRLEAIEPVATAELAGAFQDVAHATELPFALAGQPGRLVGLIPQTVATRLRGTLEVRRIPEPVTTGEGDDPARAALRQSLRTTRVRVSAEVGRKRLPVESLVGVPPGTIIELDRDADDPVDIYVNGRRFATGRLVLTDTAEWAVRVEQVL